MCGVGLGNPLLNNSAGPRSEAEKERERLIRLKG